MCLFTQTHQWSLTSTTRGSAFVLPIQILLWAKVKLFSLRSVYIPGHLSQGADILLTQGLRPRRMEDLEGIQPGRRRFVCFSRDNTLSTLILPHVSSSSWTGCFGTDLAEAVSVHISPDCSSPRSSGERGVSHAPSEGALLISFNE